MSLQNFYVISRDLDLCEPTCTMCCEEISGLKDGPVKLIAWAYRHDRSSLKHMQKACPSNAFRIDPIL